MHDLVNKLGYVDASLRVGVHAFVESVLQLLHTFLELGVVLVCALELLCWRLCGCRRCS